MIFKADSFIGALPLRFGMGEAEVIETLGAPKHAGSNWQGVRGLDYYSEEFSLNVGLGGPDTTVDHLGFGKNTEITFMGLDPFSDRTAWKHFVAASKEPHEWVGFLILPDLGVAMTGFHDDCEDDLAFVLFSRGSWDHKRDKWKVYPSL